MSRRFAFACVHSGRTSTQQSLPKRHVNEEMDLDSERIVESVAEEAKDADRLKCER